MDDGSIYRCRSEDIDELVDFIDSFHKEIGIDQKDRNGYSTDAEKFIYTGNMAYISLVFTRPGFRRKHYAQNLIYQVTKKQWMLDMFPRFIQMQIIPLRMLAKRR